MQTISDWLFQTQVKMAILTYHLDEFGTNKDRKEILLLPLSFQKFGVKHRLTYPARNTQPIVNDKCMPDIFRVG